MLSVKTSLQPALQGLLHIHWAHYQKLWPRFRINKNNRMKTIRKRWMWRRVMEKDLQDIPPGYPSEIFCLTKRSNPKSISWHFQSKRWTHSLKHTHTLLCICFSSRRSTFHPCVEVEGLCPDMSGQELKICDACTQRARAATQAKQIKYPRSYRAAGLPKK